MITNGLRPLSLLIMALTSSSLMADAAKTNQYWWPKRLDLSPLRHTSASANPYGATYNYAKEFNKLNLAALVEDLNKLMTTSQDWWPADYGNYGPFFIRMSWHAAGTYRIYDGRGGAEGGMQRFAPLNSWPDNVNLDKARRLLWPIKQKYGEQISWSDLLVLAGTVAIDNMGLKTIGFAGGRIDAWEPEMVNWGSESEWLASTKNKSDNKLEKPLAATQMGLIYVNPEGPDGKPDPIAAAHDIRVTFKRMAMNDEETVALIAGGHTFGKAHGASTVDHLGPAPEAAGLQEQDLGWKNSFGTGNADDTITSGLEGAWSVSPVKWSQNYLENLFGFNWVQTKSPAGATQWIPDNKAAANLVPDAHDPAKRHAPMMFTTDLSLKFDPKYRKIAERFQKNPKEFEEAFAKAWFKLTHRDMGPRSRYLGNMVPKEVFIWQDPVPAVDFVLVDDNDVKKLKKDILSSGLSDADLIKTAWASASTFRGTDMRGGANGARIRLAPQKDWAVNEPQKLMPILQKLEEIATAFNQSQKDNKKISVADMIVLGGSAAIEHAAEQAGYSISVPFTPGRTDATLEQTDVASFEVLKPTADGFRNYYDANNTKSPEEMLVEKASMLDLNIPEMTVLIGGMRVLNANADGSPMGVFTNRVGQLTNDFFINLLDMSTNWKKSDIDGIYEGFDVKTGVTKWNGTAVDLVFGANSELRAVAEVYASKDSGQKFVDDFAKAWVKVMNLDRFDVKNASIQ